MSDSNELSYVQNVRDMQIFTVWREIWSNQPV